VTLAPRFVAKVCRPCQQVKWYPLTSRVGYRIRLSADAADSLQHLLPPRLWNAFQATCAELKDNGHQLDAITGKATRWASGPPQAATHQSKAYNADRAILRGLLLSGLSENVGFDMRFAGYRTAPDGGLDLDFSDHTSIHTKLLVGADGVRSGARRLRMPGLGLLDTEGRAVFGKTPITPGFFDRVPQELNQGLSLIGESNDSKMKLFCDTMTFDRARGEQAAQSLGLRLPDDYLYWVLVFRRDAVEDGVSEEDRNPLTPEQSAAKAQRLTAHWHPRIRSILTEQDPSAASSLTFLAANPQDLMTTWSEKPSEYHTSVTLLGDAAHPMPPVGGFGASTAFQDAASLCDALVHGNDAEAQIRSYEQEMCARAHSVVRSSIEGSGRFFGMRPIEELKLASSAWK
jgi:2-polyprenyl-6-methoxyphenol hydroxylase-like FAD-dependent oxidoreductase